MSAVQMLSAPPSPQRTNTLANAFQDVITVVLRVRYRTQRVSDANSFRDSLRKMIGAAAGEARRLQYSDASTQMALYAVVGFLDESALNTHDPVFTDWSHRPLQVEMFGGDFAGEYFFRHVSELLNTPDSSEVADVLELHAICLLLGYRGKFAFGNGGEVTSMLHRIREKIARVRGPLTLTKTREAPPVAAVEPGDAWVRRLLLTTGVMALLVILAFVIYRLTLSAALQEVALSRRTQVNLALNRNVDEEAL